jgi:acyl-homoserine lactone acylase PvdQ
MAALRWWSRTARSAAALYAAALCVTGPCVTGCDTQGAAAGADVAAGGPTDAGAPEPGALDAAALPDAGTSPEIAGPEDAPAAVDTTADGAAPRDAAPDDAPPGDAEPGDARPVDAAAGDAADAAGTDTIFTGGWLPTDDRVHVFRDEWGVPHVFARDPWGAGYGVGQAQAEDLLPALLRNLWLAQGRLAEIDGPSVLNVDRTMRLVRQVEAVRAWWDQYDPDIQAVLEGFAAGVNDWMAAHPEDVPAWAEPIAPEWPAAFANLLFVTFQVGAANGDRAGLAPPLSDISFDGWREFNNTQLPAGLLPGTKAAPQSWPPDPPPGDGLPTGLVGSNAWAVAPARSAEPGVGYHLGDPHMPWNGPWRVWELHVRSPEIEVAGAAFVGLPVPVFARNADVVWSFTMNGPDGGDAYRLTLDPADPERYLFDGEPRAFEARDEVFRVAGGEDVTLRLRWSVHGPVTWHDPARGYAVAYRLTGQEQPGAAAQFYQMVTARDLDELEAALSHLAITRFHVVAADTAGNLLYAWNARLPRRPAGYDYDTILDGTTSANLTDVANPVPWGELPRLRNPSTGWVQNCNNGPWNTTGTAEDPDRADFPAYGFPGDEDSERAWRTRQALRADGDLTEDEARAIAVETRMLAAPVLLPLLREAWATWGPDHPDALRLAEALAVLDGWEGSPDPQAVAPTVFMLFMYQFFGQLFIPVEPLEWTLADLDEERGRALLDAFSGGLDVLAGQIGTWRVPWGVLHAINLGPRRFPVASAQYPAVSLFNCNVDPLNDPELTCRIGSAYTFFSRIERPIRTWSVLPLGQTLDRRSPYFYAMTETYAAARLKPLAFADVELAERTLVETVFAPLRPADR